MSKPAFTHEVSSRAQLIAAIKSVAQPSFEQAREHPARIKVVGTRTEYYFPNGVTEKRAAQMVHRIQTVPMRVFRE